MPTLMDDDWDRDGQDEVLMPYDGFDEERTVDDLDEEFGLLGGLKGVPHEST